MEGSAAWRGFSAPIPKRGSRLSRRNAHPRRAQAGLQGPLRRLQSPQPCALPRRGLDARRRPAPPRLFRLCPPKAAARTVLPVAFLLLFLASPATRTAAASSCYISRCSACAPGRLLGARVGLPSESAHLGSSPRLAGSGESCGVFAPSPPFSPASPHHKMATRMERGGGNYKSQAPPPPPSAQLQSGEGGGASMGLSSRHLAFTSRPAPCFFWRGGSCAISAPPLPPPPRLCLCSF